MKNKREKDYLVRRILDKIESSSVDWRENASGNRSLKIQQEDFNRAGKSELLEEARMLEQRGLIQIKWLEYGNDIEKITYCLKQAGRFYELSGLTPKWERIQEEMQTLCKWSKQAQTGWLKAYYEDQAASLEKGKQSPDLSKYGEQLFTCLDALEKLKEPVYQRVFSVAVLGSTKVFENVLRTRVVSILSTYHPDVDEAMNDKEILSQVYLEEYAQELAVKGNLKIILKGKEISLADFYYGTVLNTKTLRHAEVPAGQNIRKIITVENKANYVSMPYEEETLIIFSHGFFSPLECEFLRKLLAVLPDVEFYHTGDLDYGGIRIFRHIREHVCPRVRPLSMDADQYDYYIQRGYEIKPETLKKLEDMRGTEPLMEELIEHMIKGKMGIEQECFLI